MSFAIHFLDRNGDGIGGGFYSPVVPRFGERVQLPQIADEQFVVDVVYRAAGNELRCAFVTVSPPVTDGLFDDLAPKGNGGAE